MIKRIAMLAGISCFVSPAFAGFERWTIGREADPFSGGQKVMIDYSSSIRSGVFIECDSSEEGLEVRSLAGWDIDGSLIGTSAETSIAIDGSIVIESSESMVGACGESIACTSAKLSKEKAKVFATAMVGAKKQVALKDGISDKPFLLRASGSTSAGQALLECLEKQKN